MGLEIRRLRPADAAAYRSLMLAAYEQEPEAFTSTVKEREGLPLAWWIRRVADDDEADQLVVGALADAELVGVAGVGFELRERTRHRASLFGVFVRPDHRDAGMGRALVESALAWASARPGVEVVKLTVAEPNDRARRFYESCGFVSFGTEPCANKLEGRYVPLVHMWRRLDGGADDPPPES